MRRFASAMAATGLVEVEASTVKPGGTRVTSSPWLIQTDRRPERPRNRSPRRGTRIMAWPYSRRGAAQTLPPRSLAMSCMP